jgi:type I restriction-modification system DNA methylase subunit
MTAAEMKAAAKARVAALVTSFRRNEADYLNPRYNETQARTDFITPLLEAFGWDVYNRAALPNSLREVVEEATVEVGERLSKKPDYELRLARQRKFFVEAKKPSISIDRDREAAFQTRRYGYSASMPISVLTNFHKLVVYDCRPIADPGHDAAVARLHVYDYTDFEARFDELWDLISRDVVYSGAFDARYAIDVTRRGADQFDDLFLRQVKSWRHRLAINMYANNPRLSPTELTYAVQLFLSRIVFLRICEDRDIERYETLKNLPAANTFDALIAELRRADAFYDSGLFRLIDDARLGVRISDDVLYGIIDELYYPQSPYTFAVVETEVLGEIYEQFLGEVITIEAGNVIIVSKPEVRESGGVVPTPRYIVDAILDRTLTPAIAGRSPTDLAGFTVADICCGSGIFLLSVYEFLLDHHLEWYRNNNPADHRGTRIYEVAGGHWRLTFEERRRILIEHVRGVDIDPNAVEVARFSLLLKLIEDENDEGLRDYVARQRQPALPELDTTIRFGNSLVSHAEWAATGAPMPAALRSRVNPFDWRAEFPVEFARGGFDIIVANPPYTRIQHMQTYMPEELAYYRSAGSPYTTAHEHNFDKYALFIERALTLLRPAGLLGVIVQHKFMTTRAGRALRQLIAGPHLLANVVHFGAKRVFGRNIDNYTCIMVLDRGGRDRVRVEIPDNLDSWRYGAPAPVRDISAANLTSDSWQFANEETQHLFERIRVAFPTTLGQVAEVSVGVQTSADAIYMFRAIRETATTVVHRWNGRDWPVERGIVKPCLQDVVIHQYERPEPNQWMIFPYQLVPHRAGTRARLIQPGEMQRDYPGCWDYLSARRAELEARNIVGGLATERQFYQFGRSQSLTKIHGEKIIVRTLSLEARYAFDDLDTLVTGGGNGPYYMIRPQDGADVSNLYLLAILHHPLSEAFIRTETSVFQGGYYSHGKQYIEGLPMPLPVPQIRATIEQLVRELLNALEDAKTLATPHQRQVNERHVQDLKTRIEAGVSAVFGLTNADMDIVRAVPIPV